MVLIPLIAQDVSKTEVPVVQPPADATTNALKDNVRSLLPSDSPEWVQAAVEYGIPYGIGAIKVLIILFVTWIISGILSRVVTRGLEKAKFDETLTKFFAKMARWAVMALGLLGCLSIFGIETTSFAAVLGAMGLAIGLAFQGTLSNFASGVMLLVFRPFKVGQYVKVGGEAGTVNEIDLFATTLDTVDNRRVIIPNSSVFGATIENVSHHSKRRIDVNVGTEYAADLDQTRAVLEGVLANLKNTLKEPEPVVMLQELGGSSIDWQLRVWVKADMFWEVKQQLIRATKYALDRAEIGIPYPQMDVHLDQVVAS